MDNLRDFLIQQLSTLKVKNQDKVEEYVDYCLNNKLETPIKFKSNLHHILPKAKSLPFSEYKNLNECPWNGVNLLYKDHYIAHSILAEAISSRAISQAWHVMNITSDDTHITPELYQTLYEEHKRAISEFNTGRKRSEETKQNISNALANRKLSDSHVEKMRAVKRTEEQKENLRIKCSGRKHTEEEIEKQIKAQIGKKQVQVVCPHCGKIGGNGQMARWHFDNCKQNPDLTIEQANKNKVVCPHCDKIGGINVMARYHFDNCKWRNV